MRHRSHIYIALLTCLCLSALDDAHAMGAKKELKSEQMTEPSDQPSAPMRDQNQSANMRDQQTQSAPMRDPKAERQILVSLEKHITDKEKEKIFKDANVIEVEKVGRTPLYLVEVHEAKVLKEGISKLLKMKGVRYAEPNIRLHIFKN